MAVDRSLSYDEAIAAGALEDDHGDLDLAPTVILNEQSVPPAALIVDDRSALMTPLEIITVMLDTFQRYVAFPTVQAAHAVVLWTFYTHVFDAFDTSPRLHLRSAEKQSGKTRTMEVVALFARNPIATGSASVAALFRVIEARNPTLFIDEVDCIFGPKAPDGSEDVRGLINNGHRRGMPYLRCSGPNHDVHEFPTYAALCMAGIGTIPDTIEDRSITITMRRRAKNETVLPFRQRVAEAEVEPILDAIEAVRTDMFDRLQDYYPELPEWLTDRPADVWEPIIAVADVIGGEWPVRARDAAAVLLAEREGDDQTLGVRLLADVRAAMGTDTEIHTDDLLARLRRIEEAPWSDWEINPRWLANHLKPYGIQSRNIRIGDRQAKGYRLEHFLDTFERYLPEVASQASQASDQHKRETASVPGTALSVPRSQEQAPDLHRDAGTAGTDLRPAGTRGSQPDDVDEHLEHLLAEAEDGAR